ncbi:MAG TPA: LapA family protein [Opitutaceae bacterium]|nr:LapA family protein [Opitutaceae bacterium]
MRKAKLVAILVIAVLLGIVVLQNTGTVETKFLLISVEMPQVLLLLITSGAGFCLGLLVALVGRKGPPKS